MRSAAVEDYVKTIYKLQTQTETVSTSALSERTGTTAAAVTKMLKHLDQLNLVAYTPYHGVRLTPMGEKIALEVIRHHRLLELYLSQAMGYSWDQVHEEAERLEHHISEGFEESIERLLGFPKFDPHGDPIPTRDGQMPRIVTETLAAQAEGVPLIVCHVTDENPDLLRYLKERRLLPGAAAQIVDREPFGGALLVEVAGGRERISPEAAQNVFVKAASV
jgi:DtxR family Mn-dependent transcriptional regulator